MLTKIILYIALVTMPPPITFGLPPCNGSTTGLTERYDSTTGTLYVDDCLDGIPIEENLQVVDMTTSVIVIMTSKGEVTVQLPQLRSYEVSEQEGALVQSGNVVEN